MPHRYPPFDGAIANHLLAGLPREDLALLLPDLVPVKLDLHAVLHAPGVPIHAAYFVERGFLSVVAILDEGIPAEVGLIGLEGMSALPLILAADAGPSSVMVQMAGSALRITAPRLLAAIAQRDGLRRRLLRYALAFHGQVAQTAACNGRHQIVQRLARWLLMAEDRMRGSDLPMTQEFLSMMLGVRRAGVNNATGVLRAAGLIDTDRGRVTVLDRPGLQAQACGCGTAAREEYQRLLGEVSPGPVRHPGAVGVAGAR